MFKESLSGTIESNSRSLKRTISVLSMATLALAASACGTSRSSEKNNTSPAPGISQPKAGNAPGSTSPSSTEAQSQTSAPQTPSATSLSELGTDFCQNTALTNLAYQLLNPVSANNTCTSLTNSTDIQATSSPISCGSNQPNLTDWGGDTIGNSLSSRSIDICIEPNQQSGSNGMARWQQAVSIQNLEEENHLPTHGWSNGSQTINGRPTIIYKGPNEFGITYVTETYDGPYFIRMTEDNVPTNAPNISFEFIKMMESNLN